MINKKQGFSFVEILISISIITLLAVIGLNSSNKYAETRDNSKVVSDVATINNSLEAYSQENGELPMPKGNNNFFKADASYAHSYENSDTFGVHGFITNDTIPKKYMNFLPVDPRTNAFYAYGKTKATLDDYIANQYEVASVILDNGEPKARVIGNYSAETGPYNLIREYNGPDFVYDKSDLNFPYNPEELLLTAVIDSYSGTVLVNGDSNNIEKTLLQGDTIEVSAGGYAKIYFSDGTSSTLGDNSQDSSLTLSKLVFKQKNNLLTDVKLALSAGTIWTKATHLDEQSDFEIYTTDTSAAVRGTIFGVGKDASGNKSNITVQVGKVEVKEVQNITSTDDLVDELSKDTISIEKNSITTQPSIIVDDVIEVAEGGSAKGLNVKNEYEDENPAETSDSTGALDNIPEEINEEVLGKSGIITNNISPEVLFYTKDADNNNWKIKIKVNDIFKKADFIQVRYNYDGTKYKLIKNTDWADEDFIEINNDTEFTTQIIDKEEITTSGITVPDSVTKIRVAFGKRKHNGKRRLSKFKTIDISNPTTYNYFFNSPKFRKLSKKAQNRLSKKDFTAYGSDNLNLVDSMTINEDGELKAVDGAELTIIDAIEEVNLEGETGGEDSGPSLFASAEYNGIGDLDMVKVGGGNIIVSSKAIIGNSYNWDDVCTNNNKSNSFCQITDSNGGIMLDTPSNDDFIKYTFSGSEILDGDFEIEMRVRVPASDGKTHYLLHAGNKFKFFIKDKYLYYQQGSETYQGGELRIGEFNKVSIKKEKNASGENKIYIKVGDGDNWSDTTMTFDDNIENLYVGAVHGWFNKYINQFNDIIDYVRIYK